LTALEPRAVWTHFATLCAWPRPSKGEAPLRDHLRQWALDRGLAAEIDGAGNLLIRKPAAPGRAGAPGVILQAHLDMVCQKNDGVSHDFTRDPIRPVLRDGWLSAEATTLGADNGIGVALILAALASDTLAHGPLEALLTVDEEAGMGGARGLAADSLAGSLMLNLDTEEWGQFYLGCAGGMDVNVSRAAAAEPTPAGYRSLRIELRGLRGGHSGVDIHEERGNAVKLLVRVLLDLGERLPMRLAALRGGSARNALPREAFATVAVPAERTAALAARLADWQALLRDELAGVDEALTLGCAPAETSQVLAASEQTIWLRSLHAAPHGVRRMSRQVPGVVETSDNLGMVDIAPAGGTANFMVRSLRASAAEALAGEIVGLFALSGTQAATAGQYPGWQPNPDSPLLALCQSVYRREFGAEASLHVIHAGLECGLIAARYPGLDIVSFGPTIRGAHAPGESVAVASVGKTWQLLQAILTAVR
jgi:dipeptidase D